jgi:anti-anti-sigma factor
MKRPFQQIAVEREGDTFFVHIPNRRIDENGIHVLGGELTDLIAQDGCRRLVLSLGPGTLDCLYSVFLGKLVMVQRLLHQHEGVMVLHDVTPEVRSVFEACQLQHFFEIAPDRASALAALARKSPPPT